MRLLLALLALFSLASPAAAKWGPQEIDLEPIKGVYVGTYYCGQGATAADLILYRAKSGAVEALFNFYPTPGHPRMPHGVIRYSQSGKQYPGNPSNKYDASSFGFDKAEWLLKAEGYYAPSLSVIRLKTGAVTGHFQGCERMKLKKVDVSPETFAAFEQNPASWQNAMVAGKDYPYASGNRTLTAEETKSPYMTGDELRQLVSGKTLIEKELIDKSDKQRQSSPPYEIYFQPDGQVFMQRMKDFMRTRAHWEIAGDMICLPGAYSPCSRYERKPDGKIIRTYAMKLPFSRALAEVTVLDGDPKGIVTDVTRIMPKEAAMPADASKSAAKKPDGLLEPSMK